MEAKHIKDVMEAYASVYGQSENQEVISEDLQQKVGQALDAAAKNPVIKAIGKVIAPVGSGRGTVTKAEQEAKVKQNLNQDVDLFDLVKGHLMSEGYADTEEAALAIMANMSEEWKKSVIEQMTINVADVKGGTQAAKNAAAGMKDKSGNPMYKPGVGVGPDFKLLKGV
jgi:hypothetical protein